jgi:Cytochrome c
MSQQKYLVYAVLILLLCAGAYFVIQKLSQTKIAESSTSRIIDYEKSIDSMTKAESDGKILFMSKCTSCHAIFKNDGDMSRLLGFTEREPWNKRQNVYDFIRNPAAFMKKNEYARNLKKIYGSMMIAFPDLTNEEIDSICDYLKYADRQHGLY